VAKALAKSSAAHHLGGIGQGKLSYMSPEQLTGGEVDHAPICSRSASRCTRR